MWVESIHSCWGSMSSCIQHGIKTGFNHESHLLNLSAKPVQTSILIHNPLVFTSSANVKIKRICFNFNYKGLYHSTMGPSQLMVRKCSKRLFNKKTCRYANVEHNCSSSSSTIRSSSPMEYWVPASAKIGIKPLIIAEWSTHWYWIQVEYSYLWTWICDQIALSSGEFWIIQGLPVTSDRDTAGSCCFQFQKLFKELFRFHFFLGIHHCLLMIPFGGDDFLGFCLFWKIFLSLLNIAKLPGLFSILPKEQHLQKSLT